MSMAGEMLNLDELYYGFHEFPRESILIYMSYLGLESPSRVLESCSIGSVRLKIHTPRGFILKRQRFIHESDIIRNYIIDAGNAIHLTVRISDLQEINVQTLDDKDFRYNIQEEGEQNSSKSSDLDAICEHDDAVLHLFVKKQPKFRSKSVKKVIELGITSPDMMRLEPVVYCPHFTSPPEILSMIESTLYGLRNRKSPLRSPSHLRELYAMSYSSGDSFVSFFRPINEKACATYDKFIILREEASREVAAYLLDHRRIGHKSDFYDDVGFAGVPPTALVRCRHDVFNPRGVMEWKVGSLQKHVQHDRSCNIFEFPVEEVHKVSVLDIRFANKGRLSYSIAVDRERSGKIRLIPIGHWYCFPDYFVDLQLCWRDWPQAREPFSPEIVKYVKSLDAEKDIQFLKLYGWEMGSDNAITFKISTMLLKEAVKRNLSAFQIANIMTLHESPDDKNTFLEKMIIGAEDPNDDKSIQADLLHKLSRTMKVRLDEMKTRLFSSKGSTRFDWLLF